MKKIKLLGFICAVFTVITFWACSKDSESYQPDEFLQFSGNVNFSQLNNAESVILQKAQKKNRQAHPPFERTVFDGHSIGKRSGHVGRNIQFFLQLHEIQQRKYS